MKNSLEISRVKGSCNRHALQLFFQNQCNFVLHKNTKHDQSLKTVAAEHAGYARAFYEL